ncbi:unnamed protein product [Calicophoron daubneyi]|uniref:Rho-GAP domain-containing protein n=1 Tax=Calicophoron daubneyi TaxID=300641 RepID=A0AAV2TKE9_CALDB
MPPATDPASSLTGRVQDYLCCKLTEKEVSSEQCVVAFQVQLVRDWKKFPRIVAVVFHGSTKQSVLFLLTEFQNALSAVDLVALDEDFQCEYGKDSSIQLRITGNRLSKADRGHRMNRTKAVCPTGDSLSQLSPSVSESSKTTSDSDESADPVRIIYLSESKEAKVVGSIRNPMHNFVLAFSTTEEAARFREQALHNIRRGKKRGVQSGDKSGTFEIGEEAVDDDTVEDNTYSWLDRYRTEIMKNRLAALDARRGKRSSASKPDKVNNQSNHAIGDIQIYRSDNGEAAASTSGSSLSNDTSPICLRESEHHSSPELSDVEKWVHPSRLRHARSSITLGLEVPVKAETANGVQLSNSNDDYRLDSSLTDFSQPVSNNIQSVQSRKASTLAQSCSDLCAKPEPPVRRKNKSFIEDPIFRSRLYQAEYRVRQKLMERMDEYCSIETVSVFIGTWNVNGRQDSSLELDDWLRPPDRQPPADIYIFGFQELDLSLGSVALNKTAPAALEDKWTAQVESALGGLLLPPISKHQSRTSSSFRSGGHDQQKSFPAKWSKHTGGGYLRLGRARLAGILLLAYVSARVLSHAHPSEISVQLVPTGILNMMGNKGAVGIRLTLFNTGLCFINCHLAAGEDNLERRNQDFHEIRRKMVFPRRTEVDKFVSMDYLSMDAHDIVFIFGDMNYRIHGLDSTTVRRFVEKGDLDHILGFDELTKQCASRRAFDGFQESAIKFQPTYKFDMNTNVYDSSEKNRIPSYCDRILWRGENCEPLVYRSHMDLKMSDHKPVSGYFMIGVRRVHRQLFQQTYEAVVRSQDLLYNLSLPQAQLDTQEIDFGSVRFYEVSQRTITLKNTGLSSLEYEFLREGIAEFPPWLTVSPDTMMVRKDASVEINVEIFVKPEIVSTLNSGASSLSAIIVLRLQGGKDYFITVSGQFVPTSFGLPLTLLLSLDSTPVAWLPADELKEKIKNSHAGEWKEAEPSVVAKTTEHSFNIPKEIFRIVDYISQHMDETELFRQSGLYSDVGVIRDILDTTTPNVSFPETVSVHSAAFCLLIFLNTLTEPVIPKQFQAPCLEASTQCATAFKALSRLPIDYQNLFCYIVAFLRRCLTLSEKNGTDVQLLASAFGDVIFRDSLVSARTQKTKGPRNSTAESAAMFVRHFLVNDPSAFLADLHR